MLPGHFTISGQRVPLSYTHRLPRGSPRPWSPQNTTIVLSASPSRSSACSTSPTPCVALMFRYAKNGCGSFPGPSFIQFFVVVNAPSGTSKLKSVFPGHATWYPAFCSRLVNVGGGGTARRERMCIVPKLVGYIPVIIPLRLGAQTGACV
jgi:hypothetical protein